jgi:hypothetical protein
MDIVCPAHFDSIGAKRARCQRIDDVALILCYRFTSSNFRQQYRSPERIWKLRELVDAYDAGLHNNLSSRERAALPFALVRNVLPPFCNLWHVRDEAVHHKYVGQITDEVEWSLELLAEIDSWQRGLT